MSFLESFFTSSLAGAFSLSGSLINAREERGTYLISAVEMPRARELGLSGYIGKPIDATIFAKQINQRLLLTVRSLS